MGQYKMLKVDKETHNAVLKYISKRHLETDYKMTVNEAIRELLDIACNGKGKKKPTS